MQSLDGYVDHDKMEPGPELFRYFIGLMGRVSGSLYGRKVYELMRYWEVDDPAWPADFKAFAAAWRKGPKWVVSRTLKSVGPGATLIEGDLATAVGRLKAEHEGEIEVAGPKLAQSLTELGLIDEYRPIFRPYVHGGGAPFFLGAMPPLRLLGHERLGEDAVMMRYARA